MELEVKNLSKSYCSFEVLKNINFKCFPKDVLVILGPSGSGKSTLLKTLNLLELAQDGELEISGQSFNFQQKINEEQKISLRKKVGMVFQQYNLWPHLKVLDNLTAAPIKVLKQNKKDARIKAKELLTQLEIQDKLDSWPLLLSGGQQQRVAIARALMMEPDVLLFDEPTAALDPKITNQVVKIVNDLKHTEITQIIVTHEVEFAKKIATHVLYLEDGKVIEYGDQSIFNNPQTEKFKHYLNM